MKIRPLADRIVVKPIESRDVRPSGLVIPDTARENPQMGEVIACGPGRRLKSGMIQPLTIPAGSRVMFAPHAGTRFELEGGDVLILNESDVLGVAALPGESTSDPPSLELFQPLADNVVVELVEAEAETEAGIVIPDTAKTRPQMGRVVSAGPGRIAAGGELEAMQVQTGDMVLFNPYAGTELPTEAGERLVLQQSDILGVRWPDMAPPMPGMAEADDAELPGGGTTDPPDL